MESVVPQDAPPAAASETAPAAPATNAAEAAALAAPAPSDAPPAADAAATGAADDAIFDPSSTGRVSQEHRDKLLASISFEELGIAPELLTALRDDFKFAKPAKVQAEVLPHVLSMPLRNVIAQAPAGSGKSICFLLAMFSRVDTTVDAPQAIYVAPTRELAIQTFHVARRLGKYTGVKQQVLVRGAADSAHPESDETGQLVFGTPGTLLHMMERKRLKLSAVKLLVLDEADQLLDAHGFLNDMRKLKRMLVRASRDPLQVLLFSATFSSSVRENALEFAPDAVVNTKKYAELRLETVSQFCVRVEKSQKPKVVEDLVTSVKQGQFVVFMSTVGASISLSGHLSQHLRAKGITVSNLHGRLTPEERDSVMEDFRRGRTKVLVATNVLSRGVDVPAISMVINYDLPLDEERRPDKETFQHRIGRTARFGRIGAVVTLLEDEPTELGLRKICSHLKYPDPTVLTMDDLEELAETIETKLNSAA